MDEPTPGQKPDELRNKVEAQPKNKNMGKWLSIALAVLLVVALAFLAWYWNQAEADKKKLGDEKAALQSQLDVLIAASKGADADAESGAEVAECKDTVSDFYAENIKAALDSQNTAVFSTYTSNPVHYLLAASEFAKDMTPDEAALTLDYTHSATGPWDFSLDAGTLAMYDAGFYTNHFDAKRYVGKAASGMVVSFGFNCDGKINKIFVSVDDDLLL